MTTDTFGQAPAGEGDSTPTADEQQAAAALERAGHIVERNDRQIPIGLTVRGRGKPLPDQTMPQVHKLAHLEKVFLCNVRPADLDLAGLKNLARLNNLGIGYSREKLSEQDMAHIGSLTGLRKLNVTVPVPDAGLAHLAGLADLENLILSHSNVTDAALVNISRCSKLKNLVLAATKITDAGLAHIQGLKSLERLWLIGTEVGDSGVEKIAGLTGLQELGLGGTKVTDAGLAHLQSLANLKTLRLDDTQVTDAGLERLEGLKALQSLDLEKTKVTDAGVKRLQKALPNCKILR
jgi:Leucine-rich repeat (LRR) protein